MRLLVGTSGFSYKEWKGGFYPEGLPAKSMLGYYAERLPAVEINNTFYRMPKTSVLEGWADSVPEDFRFAIKASRRITHMKRLKDAGEETDFLLSNLAVLGPRLGCVLFQLPPNLRADRERIERFLEHVPEDVPAVFEFRHDSWLEGEVPQLLRARGIAVCAAETDDTTAPALEREASFGYLRLRKSSYAPGELEEWALLLRGIGWREAFVFFKHEAQGPRLAMDLQSLASPLRAASRRRAAGEAG
jgi:uncharacterized protein YecE (DUF72 family)